MKEIKIVWEDLIDEFKIEIKDITNEVTKEQLATFPKGIHSSYTKKIRSIFTEELSEMGRKLKYPLTMKGRRINFEKFEVINIFDEKKRIRLEQDNIKKIIGEANRLCNGTFMLRVAISSQEIIFPKLGVLETLAHEYGHTLGNLLEDKTYEELKAYTFSSLFLKNYCGETPYAKKEEDYPWGSHGQAKRKLNEILNLGISEEAIISHLIKERFGKSNPDDLFELLK